MVDYTKKRFLVIDDQKLAREALRTVAQNMGAFLVEFSSSYPDAIHRIRNNPPDVVLCDYILGDGRSGQQLLEELRRFNLLPDETIFIMVTGEQSYEQVVAAVELVPDDYLIKPFAPDKLMLRLDRLTARKEFFQPFYAAKRRNDHARALALLADGLKSDAGRPYRFESLRYMAETQLRAGQAAAAEATYRSVLEMAALPWARAGLARTLHRQQRLDEARSEIDPVVAAQPDFFDAADLKAAICLDQGEPEEAQRVLDMVARRTPRNYVRKRLLAEAAALNGDMKTANAVMQEVLANDSMPGAVTVQDKLAMARSQIGENHMLDAARTLALLTEPELQHLALPERASYTALLYLCSPSKGKTRFAGLRPALLEAPLPAIARCDVLRAALVLGDNELADYHAKSLMAGEEAKRVFPLVRALYSARQRADDFRDLQRQAALARIHH